MINPTAERRDGIRMCSSNTNVTNIHVIVNPVIGSLTAGYRIKLKRPRSLQINSVRDNPHFDDNDV